MQRPTKLALLILLMLVTVSAYTGASAPQETDRDVANIVLHAYLNEHLTILDGKVLGVSPTWGELIRSNATIENLFTLYPALGGDLKVKGTIIFKGWLRADRLTFGKLVMSLYEKTEYGDQLQVTSVEGFVAVTSRRSEYTFGVAGVEYTFKSGSTIQFGLIFHPSEERRVKVYLEWNDPEAQTRVILPCIGHINRVSSLWDLKEDKKFGKLISLNESKIPFEASLRVNVTDVFGIDDVKSINLTLKDLLGIKIMENEPMTLVSYGSQLYNAVYAKNLTLSKGIRIAEVTILDSSGNIHKFVEELHLTYYYMFKIKVMDGEGRAISNATYHIINENAGLAVNGFTEDGLILYPLPASSTVGTYNLNISYRGISVKLQDIKVDSPIYREIIFPLYLLRIKVVTYGIPLYNAKVSLWNGSTLISSGSTDLSGRIGFDEMPLGNYSVDINYILQTYRTGLNFREHGREYEIKFNPPLFRVGPWILLGIAAALSLNLITKKRERTKISDFKYFDKLFIGRLPEALSIMILGPPGSGKTATLESFVKRFLQEGRKCIYISNTGFPEEIRKSLKGFSVPIEKFEGEGKLMFIDCYSSIAGRESKEKHFIESPSDLTRLGIEITACLESSNKDADLFFDSLSQLSTYVKSDHLLSFINTVGARMKDNRGRFIYTVGSNIEPELLGMLEEVSDCIIELQIRDRDGIQERNLRIKKFRGKRHSSRWIEFEVHPNKGVVLITKHRLF